MANIVTLQCYQKMPYNQDVARDLSFLKKLAPRIDFSSLFGGVPTHVAGLDIGTYSTKVVQLRYEKERGILETYGELLNEGYFKGGSASFLHRSDEEVANLVRDLIREANVTSREISCSVPAGSSFVTLINLPSLSEKDIKEAVPYEARRYIPIPISEAVLDWEVLGPTEERGETEVMLAAVPREIVEKFKRIAALADVNLRALEIEVFGILRALGQDPAPTAFINLGHQTTTIAIGDKGKLRMMHGLGRGALELTKALEKGLGITRERAEEIKREVGLSEKSEEREIVSVIIPFIETLLSEMERFISAYNRKAPRTVQKINLTGGGSNLKGLIEYTVSRFGIEVTRGNPFARVVTPAFVQPVLRGLGPSFSVAVGLALREITSR